MSDDQAEPGWFQDPTKRFEYRYWDGVDWTQWVLVAGAQQVDRFWTGPTAELELSGQLPSRSRTVPESAHEHPAVSPTRVVLRDRLFGQRPPASASSALGAAAGVLAVLGAFAVTGGPPDRVELILLGAIITVVAYGLALVGPESARAAGLAGAIAGPALVIGPGFGIEGPFSGTTALAGSSLLLGAAWLVMFLTPGFTGAPVLLVASLVSAWSAMVTLVVGVADEVAPFGESSLFFDQGALELGSVRLDSSGDFSTAAMMSFLVALSCLVVARAVDHRGWHVLGTPLIAAGVIVMVEGLVLANSAPDLDTSLVGPVIVAFGGLLMFVGARSGRRGAVWIGAAGVAFGSFVLTVSDGTGPVVTGVLLLTLGAVLFVVSVVLGSAPGEVRG